LRRFVVKKETPGFELRQIGDLEELCGSLLIDNLEKVEVKEEAAEAKLTQKGRLHELKLCWDTDRSTKDLAQDDQVLENLKPNTNLLKLSIKGHGGTTCPSWLGQDLSIKNLESLQLSNVSWENVPPLGELCFVGEHGEECPRYIPEQSFRNLKRLELVKISKLAKWVASGPSDLFSQLKVLMIKDCPELMELPFSHHVGYKQEDEATITWFPKLEELEVTYCPKLSSFPYVPWSRSMRRVWMTQAGSGSETLHFRQLSSTTYLLEIEGTDALNSAFWRVPAFGNLSKLEVLKVKRCPSLSLVHLEKLPSLKDLTIEDSSDAFCLSEGDGQVGYQFPVESITIEQYGGSGQRLTRLFSHFPNLRSFKMYKCEKLTGLGVADLHKRTEALPRQPSISINQVEEAQVGPQEQHLQDVRGEEEIAAAAPSEGLLLLPPLLQEMWIEYCKNLVLCLGLLDGDKDPGLRLSTMARARANLLLPRFPRPLCLQCQTVHLQCQTVDLLLHFLLSLWT